MSERKVQYVDITGPDSEGLQYAVGARGFTIVPMSPEGNAVQINGAIRPFPASSLRLVPTLKPSDRVMITGDASYHGTVNKGQLGLVKRVMRDGTVDVLLDNGTAHYFLLSSLRLVPTFKPGDRVRFRGLDWNRGPATAQIECVWHSKGRADLYEIDGVRYEADELEHVPEPARVPKAGEVWELCGSPCLLAYEIDRQLLRVIHLLDGTDLMTADGGYFDTLQSGEGKFLASDLATFYRGSK